MATFKEQVQGLTGITISSSDTVPTQDQLSVFLRDAVLDVTRQTLKVAPGEAVRFLKESEEISLNNYYKHNSEIIQVLRNANDLSTEDWRGCELLPESHSSRAQDKSSLFYASKFNPAYTVKDDMTISVFPVPTSSEKFKVIHLNENPVNENGTELLYSDSEIRYFPKDKVHLVVLYAAIKSMEAQMSDFTITEEDFELATTMERTIAVFKQRYLEASMFGAPQGGGERDNQDVSNQQLAEMMKGMNDER